ncbi:hypothetical protein BgAZ_109300 [Babesia gibsoni]|uniref:RING-type E3 ubiquitin transferase n=1 Tax=Babesia gibsoni TaxID=33632 RepID=A0AAD8PGP7_BABGI|nr:hypothetical protein BgAZ_109300 [Babesia gibsoni]
METNTGSIRSENLIASIEDRSDNASLRGEGLEPIGKEALDLSTSAFNLDRMGIFSTYYTGKYEICESPVSGRGKHSDSSRKQKRCYTGDMHTSIIFRNVELDSTKKVYMLMCLELPKISRFAFWKDHRYGSNTLKRDRRVYMGFSGLETTHRVDGMYLSGLSSVMGPFTPKAPLEKYWPTDALMLDHWNEYSKKAAGPVCAFNTFIKQPIPSITQVSLRQLDEFYMIGARRYFLSDFEHMAVLDNSKFNIFNIFYREPAAPKFSGTETFDEIDPSTYADKEPKGLDEQLVDEIKGEITSSDCGVKIKFSGKERDMSYVDRMIYNFSLGFIIKSILETLVLCRQLRFVDEGAQGQTISIIAFTMISYQDALEIFILMSHRALFLKNILSFCFIIFIKFILVGIVDHSFLVLIWRANHAAQIREGWEATQKRFALFYRYYFSFLLIQGLSWYFYYPRSPWILVLCYFNWVPQILLNAWRGQCCSMHILTVIGLSLCRMYLPCYVFMFKENAFTFDVFSMDTARTNRTVGSMIMFVILSQMVLLCLQYLCGPRYLASCSVFPQIYNYVRPWTDMMQDDPQECVICMHSIIYSEGGWSITPCNHLFHTHCLKEWTSIKLECPNCRHQLPPITR